MSKLRESTKASKRKDSNKKKWARKEPEVQTVSRKRSDLETYEFGARARHKDSEIGEDASKHWNVGKPGKTKVGEIGSAVSFLTFRLRQNCVLAQKSRRDLTVQLGTQSVGQRTLTERAQRRTRSC